MYNNYNLIEFFRGGGKKRGGRPLQFRGSQRAGLMMRRVTNMELRIKLKTQANIRANKLARDAAYMTQTRTEAPLYNKKNSNDSLGRLGYSQYPNSRVGRYKLNYTGEAPLPALVALFVPVSNPTLVTSRPSALLFLGTMALQPVARTMRIGNINGKRVLIPVAAAAVGLGGAGLAYMANNYDYIDGTTSAAPVNPNSPVSPNNPNNQNNPNEPMVIYMPPDAPGSESRPYELDGTTVYGLRPNAVGSQNNPYGLNEVTVYGNAPILLVSTDSTNIYLSPDGSTWIEPVSQDSVQYVDDESGILYIKRPPYDLNMIQ